MSHIAIHEWFGRTAARLPGKTAIRCGPIQRTYREVDDQATRIAVLLRASGARQGSIAAILAENCLNVVPAIIGALRAGCAFMPLDPHLPGARLETMIAAAEPEWFIVEPQWAAKNFAAGQLAHNTIVLGSDALATAARSCVSPDEACPAPLPANLDPNGMAYIYFTSGSTGAPKGIAGRLKAIDHFIRWELDTFGLGEDIRVSQFTSPSFDASLRDYFVPLCAGGTICAPASRDEILEAERLAEWIGSERISLIHCVPSLLRMLVASHADARCFASLRHILLAGEPLTPADIRAWTERCGERAQLVNLYGPSETTMVKLFHVIQPEDKDGRTIPIGKPMSGARALVVDEQGAPCSPGAVGEIYIRTPYRALGYYRQPEATRQAFIPNPFNNDPTDVVYKTGDMGRILADGNFEFVGRRDQQVKVRGIRIELREVEGAVRTLDFVEDVVLDVREDSLGNKYLCAYLVMAEGTIARVRDHLFGCLPDYMVPSVFVVLDELPRTSSGKVDLKALPEPLAARATSIRPILPRNVVEETLASIWSEVLRSERVGVTENFFDAGGHSLLATQVLSRVRKVFQVEMSVRSFFAAPTVAGLAALIDEQLRTSRGVMRPPVKPAERPRVIPLSFSQQRLWFLEQIEPGNPAYNIARAIRISGALDCAALEAAVSGLTARHESLRTSFALVEGQPAQNIDVVRSVPLHVLDIGDIPEDVREERARELVQQESAEPFDLTRASLFRARLLRLSADDHVLVLNVHHIVSDAWSMGILFRELGALYTAAVSGADALLPELPVQYPDFALWQRQWMQGDVLKSQLSYWRSALEGVPVLTLPLDRARPPSQTFRGSTESLSFTSALSQSLKSFGRSEGATTFIVGLAGYQAVLYRYSGQEDFAVGSPIANRNATETEDLIGFFINTLVMRADLSGQATFRELVRRVRTNALEAYSHQDLPFERLVEELRPPRDPSRNPIFQVAFVVQNTPIAEVVLPGIEIKEFPVLSRVAKLDINLQLAERDGTLHATMEYNTDLFDATTIRRLLGHYRQLLESAVANPDRPIRELALLAQEERDKLVGDWALGPVVARENVCIHKVFERQVDKTPDLAAVCDSTTILTYRELNCRANQLADFLRELGVGPEVRVAICLKRSVRMIIALLGVLKAGGAYVPLDPDWPLERLEYVLQNAETPGIITEPDTIDCISWPWAFAILLDEDSSQTAGRPTANVESGVRPDNLAYVIYTSGSTGAPKGVEVPHRGLVNLAAAYRDILQLGPESDVLQFASLSFDASAEEIFKALTSGATLHIGRTEALRPGPDLRDFMRRRKITTATLPPSTLAALGDAPMRELHHLMVAGEACSDKIFERWSAGRTFLNAYGPTETTVCATVAVCESGSPLSIGRPLTNVEVHVLDPSLEPVPSGLVGELYVGGAGLARGYLGRPSQTAARFLPNPFSKAPGARIYRTGDLARWLSGRQLQYVGRLDDQVKVRGFRIEPGEIEAALLRHSQISEALVVAREDIPGDKRLVAYLIATSALSAAELRAHLESKLPSHMIPNAFVTLDAWPLTSNNKIDRRALPAPDMRPELESAYVAPRDEVERQLAVLWCEAIGIKQAGIHDNFFELGGHSLLTPALLLKIREAFNVDLPLSSIFSKPTIAELSQFLREQRPTRTSRVPWFVVPLHGDGCRRPLFCIHPLGGGVSCYVALASRLGRDQPVFGIQAAELADLGETGDQYHSLEDMAGNYVKAIRMVQPDSPYLLAGWSYGGDVAFEMAQQLLREGDQVALLALLDSRPPSIDSGEEPDFDDLTLVFGVARELASSNGRELPVTYDEVRGLGRDEGLTLLLSELKKAHFISQDAGLSWVRSFVNGFRMRLSHVRAYRPQPYPGRITLFRASDVDDQLVKAGWLRSFVRADRSYGWRRYAEEVEVHDVPGNHVTIALDPNVDALAVHLRGCIERAEASVSAAIS